MAKPEIGAFAFDGFDMGLSIPSKEEGRISIKEDLFSFSASISEPKS